MARPIKVGDIIEAIDNSYAYTNKENGIVAFVTDVGGVEIKIVVIDQGPLAGSAVLGSAWWVDPSHFKPLSRARSRGYKLIYDLRYALQTDK